VRLVAASDQPGRAARDAADPGAVARVLDQPEPHRLPMPAPVRAGLISTGMRLCCGCCASSGGHGVRVASGCQGNGKLQTKAGQRSGSPFLLSPDLSETLLRPFRNGSRIARTNPRHRRRQMNSEQADRNDHYLAAQMRLDAFRAWRRPRPPLRISVARERSRIRPRRGAIPRGHFPRGTLAA
jgi:hypothetical protein